MTLKIIKVSSCLFLLIVKIIKVQSCKTRMCYKATSSAILFCHEASINHQSAILFLRDTGISNQSSSVFCWSLVMKNQLLAIEPEEIARHWSTHGALWLMENPHFFATNHSECLAALQCHLRFWSVEYLKNQQNTQNVYTYIHTLYVDQYSEEILPAPAMLADLVMYLKSLLHNPDHMYARVDVLVWINKILEPSRYSGKQAENSAPHEPAFYGVPVYIQKQMHALLLYERSVFPDITHGLHESCWEKLLRHTSQPEILAYAAMHPKAEMRCLAAEKTKDPTVLASLHNDVDPWVVISILKNRAADVSVQQEQTAQVVKIILANQHKYQHYEWMSFVLENNTGVRTETLQEIAQFLQTQNLSSVLQQERRRLLATHPQIPVLDAYHLILQIAAWNKTDRKKLLNHTRAFALLEAADQAGHTQIWDAFVIDPDWEIRQKIAQILAQKYQQQYQNLPQETQQKKQQEYQYKYQYLYEILAADSYEYVRREIADCHFASTK